MQNDSSGSPRPSLLQLQQQFADAMLDYRQTGQLQDCLQPAEGLIDKVALYRGNLTAIWRNTLQNAYPVLQQLVGPDYFSQMARAYGLAVPSGSGDLNQFGAGLAGFLGRQPELMQDYPYFAEMAGLEWALHAAYYAADHQHFGLPELQQFALQHGTEGGIAGLALRLNPAVCCLACNWNSLAIWQAHQGGAEQALPALQAVQNHVLVSRPDWHPLAQPISAAEYAALEALCKGQALAAALTQALDLDSDFDPAASLANWFAMHLFDGCYLPAPD